MNRTAFALAAKDCLAHTVYSEIGGVLLYNIITRPQLVELTLMRIGVNLGTCMLAEYMVSQEDSSTALDVAVMGVRTGFKAGLIRAARRVVWEHKSGSIGQSTTCGFLGGVVNALLEPYSPVFVGDTTSLNTLAGDTTNGICNVLFTIQNPEQCLGIMRDKVSIGVLREVFKPIAEFGSNYLYDLLPNFFTNDVDSLPAIECDKLIESPDTPDKTDKALVQSPPPNNNYNSGSNSEDAAQGQSSDCGLDSSLKLNGCVADEESDQSS